MKMNQEKHHVSRKEAGMEDVRAGKSRKRLPEETRPGRILRNNPDYEAILAVVEQEAGRKETDFT